MASTPQTPPTVAIHPGNRMIWQPGGFFGALLPGSGATAGSGIGDCLLAAPANGCFAVADASDRCPGASRTLLERFNAAMMPGDGPAQDAAVSTAYARQRYTDRSTFCCAVLGRRGQTPMARIYNGGDSVATVIAGGRVIHRTAADMGFAGRSPTAPVGVDVPLPGTDWVILLASDGWHDVMPPVAGDTLAALCRALVTGAPPHLARVGGADDLAYILISPGALSPPVRQGPAILMGGTSAADAAAALNQQRGDPAPPHHWLPAPAWQHHGTVLDAAGIRILAPPPSTPTMETAP